MVLVWSLLAIAAIIRDTAATPSNGPKSSKAVNATKCNGNKYSYTELAGYGLVPSNARDKFGDTLGGFGSSIALDSKTWTKHKNGSYTGILWTLPDRGWNTEGTLNYQNRVHKFAILFSPTKATSSAPSVPNLQLYYLNSIGLTSPTGDPTTGLDPTAVQHLPSFPPLPLARYTGDGFGGPGPGGARIALDTEGLVLASDGSFWISDEYGPYLYHFSKTGRMLAALAPPAAIVPRRNGTRSFSAASPPRYDPNATVVPEDPESGRSNNQGFEGLAMGHDGKRLFALLQSAAVQEGGADDATRRHARLVEWDVTMMPAKYVGERVVPLPLYQSKEGSNKVAAQSEIYALDNGQFFVLARDSGAGRGADDTQSLYRQIDVFDIEGATNVKGDKADAPDGQIADEDGKLNEGVEPAEYCPFLDFNVNAQLGKFGLHNGGAQDAGLLNEKWEGLVVAPVEPGQAGRGKRRDVFVFAVSDNDFITQDGSMDGGGLKYKDESGFDVDTQALVFRVEIGG